jgi:hypothetical protein
LSIIHNAAAGKHRDFYVVPCPPPPSVGRTYIRASPSIAKRFRLRRMDTLSERNLKP